MSSRVRSRPQRLQDEQEDAYVQQLELSQLLRAIELSRQSEPDTESDDSQSDSGSDEEEKKEAVLGLHPVDEKELVSVLTKEQQDEWEVLSADDMTAGWQERCRDSGRHTFTPGTQPVGCLLPTTVNTPLEVFDQLITADIIDYFCERTNANARVRKRRKRRKRTVENKENEDPNETNSDEEVGDAQWDDVTPTEMRAFIGCVMCMGIVQINDTKQYWSDDLGPAFIRNVFSRTRFLKLLASFHISEPPPDDQPSTDRLHKVRELAERLGRRFGIAFILGSG